MDIALLNIQFFGSMKSKLGRGWCLLRAAIAVLLLGTSLLAPTIINREPILYPDSVGYFHSGFAALEQVTAKLHHVFHPRIETRLEYPNLTRQGLDGVSTARSVYYGALYVVSFWIGGDWALICAQVLLTLACLIIAVRRSLEGAGKWAVLIGVSLVSGLGFFADTAMPDLFAGLMLLGAGMILGYGHFMRRWEYGFWLIIVLLACLFHKAHLAILVLLLLIVAPFLWHKQAKGLAWLLAITAVASVGHIAVDVVARQITGKPTIAPPFMLARLVGDGTAEEYLSQVCKARHFVTCRYLNRMPMEANDFLWSHNPFKSAVGTANGEVRAEISAESSEIVVGTISQYPIKQLVATLGNVVRQFITVGVQEFRTLPQDLVSPIAILTPTIEHYHTSAIAKNEMPLRAISNVMQGVYFPTMIMLVLMLYQLSEKHLPHYRFALVLLIGICANAIVCGAVSGVFDRYQGRIVWLGCMALLALVNQARGRKSLLALDPDSHSHGSPLEPQNEHMVIALE